MPDTILFSKIAQQLNLPARSVENTISLLEEGATIPFIARYRKEATNSLDEVNIADINSSWNNFQELVKRKKYILKTLEDQGNLSPALQHQIEKCWSGTSLEDIYLPFKKKRKTRADIAKAKGLEPLADLIWNQQSVNPQSDLKRFYTDEVRTADDALSGARDIIAERINEMPEVRSGVRKLYKKGALLTSKVVAKKKEEAGKYQDYFDYTELVGRAPAHRILAVFRAGKEGLLKVKVHIDEEEAHNTLRRLVISGNACKPSQEQLEMALRDSFKRLLNPSIESEFRMLYKEKADDDAIHVFTENLRQLLLAPPLGTKVTMGIDPGYRTGCKVVCLDQNGTLQYDTVVYPHPPQEKATETKEKLKQLVNKFRIDAIAIGNGTAGKETLALVQTIKFDRAVESYLVNENGASIYSASEIARAEFPDKDITVRGAVSIARRLMDPLSELVKIDPKSIGVGQYQHDVSQSKLKDNLSQCVANCVNAVGIDLNTASEHVLTYVSGLGPALAGNIVDFRKETGSFKSIQTLKKVPRMGAKAFEQSAGFLRIRNGQNPLDNTGVHPERYKLVGLIAKDHHTSVDKLIGNTQLVNSIQPKDYINAEIGLPTIKDILAELARPGLDIRGSAKVFDFTPGINNIADLTPGMRVNGIINNVTRFGAFVDIGIKEAGLIHISQLSDSFVKDPLDVVKLNQEVVARVLEVDVKRQRISLSLKKE